jgi:hypothetical protein
MKRDNLEREDFADVVLGLPPGTSRKHMECQRRFEQRALLPKVSLTGRLKAAGPVRSQLAGARSYSPYGEGPLPPRENPLLEFDFAKLELRLFEQLTEPERSALGLGGAIHRALERALQSREQARARTRPRRHPRG